MLIVNPTDESGFYDMIGDCSGAPEIYVFDERKKVFNPLKRGGREGAISSAEKYGDQKRQPQTGLPFQRFFAAYSDQ